MCVFAGLCIHIFTSVCAKHALTFILSLCGCNNCPGVKSFSGFSCRLGFMSWSVCWSYKQPLLVHFFHRCYSPITLQSHAWPDPVTQGNVMGQHWVCTSAIMHPQVLLLIMTPQCSHKNRTNTRGFAPIHICYFTYSMGTLTFWPTVWGPSLSNPNPVLTLKYPSNMCLHFLDL